MFAHKVKYCIFRLPFRNQQSNFFRFRVSPCGLSGLSISVAHFSFLPYLEVSYIFWINTKFHIYWVRHILASESRLESPKIPSNDFYLNLITPVC
jgi:hypothetical protein